MENNKNSTIIFNDNIDNTDKAILGTLEGPCADFVDPTRNGRKYSESLWEKVFQDPIVNEMIDSGGIPGELDHPTDRSETDSSRIAIIMKEKPKKKNGKLWARFNILNTPLGRILYTLVKAGFHIGISSRGNGDVEEDFNGNEVVNEDTYEFKCFDAVLLPSVKSARLSLVNESLLKNFNYKKELRECLEEYNKDEQELMKKTLEDLDIDIYSNIIKSVPGGTLHIKEVDDNKFDVHFESDWNSSYDWDKNGLSKDEVDYLLPDNDKKLHEDQDNEDSQETGLDIEDQEVMAVDNSKADEKNDLQSVVQDNIELKSQVTKLHEKLSVCYAKEKSLNEELEHCKKTMKVSAVNNKRANALENRIKSIQEQLNKAQELIISKNQEVNQLTESYRKLKNSKFSLMESVSSMKNESFNLKEHIDSLESEMEDIKNRNKIQVNKLLEDIEKLKKSNQTKDDEYSRKLINANNIVEKYKNITEGVIDRYITSQAKMLGINSNEIKNKLPSNYTLNDIDSICEDLREYKLSINKLPFRSSNNLKEGLEVKINSNERESIIDKFINTDDEIDSQLLGLIN